MPIRANWLFIYLLVDIMDGQIATHPDQFNVINSVNERVVGNTKNNLWFHANLFKDLDYPLGKMVLHIGSGAGGKEASLRIFKNY